LEILVIGICTLLCSGKPFNDMEDFGHAKLDWFKAFLTLQHGIPSHDTFNRGFCSPEAGTPFGVFSALTQSLRQAVLQELWRWPAKRCRAPYPKTNRCNTLSVPGPKTMDWFSFSRYETPGSTSDVLPGAIFLCPSPGSFLIGFQRGGGGLAHGKGAKEKNLGEMSRILVRGSHVANRKSQIANRRP
jgi:hypothetical protein